MAETAECPTCRREILMFERGGVRMLVSHARTATGVDSCPGSYTFANYTAPIGVNADRPAVPASSTPIILAKVDYLTLAKVDHPVHYGGGDATHEVIKCIAAWNLNFQLGNAVKYIARAGLKPNEPALDDLRKARWYIDWEIARLERQTQGQERHEQNQKENV